MVEIAILGYGVVGSGVAEVIRRNHDSIKRRAGKEIRVKKILDIRDFPDSPDRELITKDPDEVFSDPSISVVVETIGGTGAAREFTQRALEAGKHVVTSNKELVAAYGPQLLNLAREKGVYYLFEASVGGGIPIIRPLARCLAANELYEITGVLNGTTNYILTKMEKENMDFEEALKEAQRNGYAEANPAADVEGHDACRKIAILSSVAYNEFVDYREIYTEGISNISAADISYARAMESSIKLVAFSRKTPKGVLARVTPALVPKGHPLYNVEGVFNGIMVKGNAVGETMFFGQGAGKLPTASAVVADVIDVVKHDGSGIGFLTMGEKAGRLVDINEDTGRYFVRLKSKDLSKTRELVLKLYGDVKQVEPTGAPGAGGGYGVQNEFAFVTPVAQELEHMQKLSDILQAGSVFEAAAKIRVLDK